MSSRDWKVIYPKYLGIRRIMRGMRGGAIHQTPTMNLLSPGPQAGAFLVARVMSIEFLAQELTVFGIQCQVWHILAFAVGAIAVLHATSRELK